MRVVGNTLTVAGGNPWSLFLSDSPDSNTCTVCTLYFHMSLQCDREHREDLKYLKNVYCVMTNHSKDQDTWTGHETKN